VLPGRKYKPEDIWYLIVRWKWLILLPWVGVSVAAALAAHLIPDAYLSESTIQVVPQRVSQNYVRSAVSAKIDERLPVISQQILSRTRLERIIQDFGLYTDERKNQLMEDIVREMRDSITVAVVKGDAFKVSFVHADAKMAMKVTERLASLFVEENLRDREVLAEGANQFLDSQLDDARRRLLDHEKKLEDYRRQYAGELPSQLQSNVQAIQSLQSQIQALGESINRDRDRRLVVERQLADATAEAAVLAGSPVTIRAASTEAEQAALPAAVQLESAKNSLQQLQLRLKPDHPDVRQMKLRIRELEKKAEEEALRTPLSPSVELKAVSPAEAMRLNRVRDFKVEMETLDRDISRKEDTQKKVQVAIAGYQRRVDASPAHESELTALTRDYDTLRGIYTSLLSRGEEAKVAANLERRQIGEQFKVIDAARLPEKPFYPQREKFYAAGVGAGLLVGLLLVGFIEFRDSSFRTDDDVVTVLALPVLATIPLMVTAAEKRVMRRHRLIMAAASLMVLVTGGVAFALRSHLVSLIGRLR
jgi:polysaccharide chain length determinant protein (PEP-CTERM system associated)